MRCTNHSCQPTARLTIRGGRVESFVLVPIAPGDQITVDYGETHHEGRLACRCGAHGCRSGRPLSGIPVPRSTVDTTIRA